MPDGPKHHRIAADVPCPHCALPGLQFRRRLKAGDIYNCPSCTGSVLHNRIDGKRCGIRLIGPLASYGPVRPCQTTAAKGRVACSRRALRRRGPLSASSANLLDSAIKYSSHGGRIEVGARVAGAAVEIFVLSGLQTVEGALEFCRKSRPHLILLDVMLPASDGLDICKPNPQDRDVVATRVIFLRARASETDPVVGLSDCVVAVRDLERYVIIESGRLPTVR